MAGSKRVLIRPATPEDAALLALTLRDADRQEVRATHGEDANFEQVILRAIDLTENARTVTTPNGEVLAVYGTACMELQGKQVGVPWLLGAHNAKHYAREFVFYGIELVREETQKYAYLLNYVDVRNTTSIRWLKSIGFTLGEPEPFGVCGLPFYPFFAHNHGVHMPAA